MAELRYQTVDDLSGVLKNVLPQEAQKIYLEAYKESWENYESWKGGELGRDGVAHRNAMQAVMQEYVMDEDTGEWHKRGEGAVEEVDQTLLDGVIEFLSGLVSGGNESS